MSAMLTLLPLAMIGATVWWLARLVARADAERRVERYSDAARTLTVREASRKGSPRTRDAVG